MANQYNSLLHTKWLCKYHIVIVPKYRRKMIYNQYRKDLQEIIIIQPGMLALHIPNIEP